VSFFTDASSEIIAPLLPLFLVGTLGASVSFVGIIEGVAESVASLLKLVSGWWSDRAGRRKPLVVAGYAMASVIRPLMGFAQSSGQVLGIRVADRVGKGIRAAPRDALLSASIAPEHRGRAFGFHRSADHAGAVVGPLIAMACLNWLGMPLRHVFLVAAIPGALAVLVVVFGVREERAVTVSLTPVTEPAIADDDVTSLASTASTSTTAAQSRAGSPVAPLGAPFWRTMFAILIFTLGNSTDAFLLLRANQLGVAVSAVPLLWLVLHAVKLLSSTPGGILSDRFGRRPLIAGGWLLYALVYAGFAFADAAWQAWALFAVYGVVFGMTEGNEKALVADLVPLHRRGSAFGWYHGTIGVAALPASVLFGALWDRYGAAFAFEVGSSIALLATIVFVALVPREARHTASPA
jgi:MFS family permease